MHAPCASHTFSNPLDILRGLEHSPNNTLDISGADDYRATFFSHIPSHLAGQRGCYRPRNYLHI